MQIIYTNLLKVFFSVIFAVFYFMSSQIKLSLHQTNNGSFSQALTGVSQRLLYLACFKNSSNLSILTDLNFCSSYFPLKYNAFPDTLQLKAISLTRVCMYVCMYRCMYVCIYNEYFKAHLDEHLNFKIKF